MLIDTSGWIEFLRAKGDLILKSQETQLITQGNAAYTCPVSYELIPGAKPHELKDLRTALGMAMRVEATAANWDAASQGDAASQVAAVLRRKGMNFPVPDLLIAAVAGAGKFPLISRDGHFAMIRDHALPALQLM